MYEFFTIGEISEYLQIPKSKLRYWDREGLIELSRNSGNDYREYSIKAVTDVANIMFYRSLNVPIKELKKLSGMTVDDLENILNQTERQIDEQIAGLIKTKKRINSKKSVMAKIRAYMQTPYVISEFDFDAIVEFNRDNNQHLQECLANSEKFAVLITPGHEKDYLNGVVQNNPKPDENVIWRKTTVKCLKCLLKFNPVYPGANLGDALSDIYAYLKDNNYKYGAIVARFLIAEFGKKPTNYHEIYVELL